MIISILKKSIVGSRVDLQVGIEKSERNLSTSGRHIREIGEYCQAKTVTVHNKSRFSYFLSFTNITNMQQR